MTLTIFRVVLRDSSAGSDLKVKVTLFSKGKIYLTPSLTAPLVSAEPFVSSIFQSVSMVSTIVWPSASVTFSTGLGS